LRIAAHDTITSLSGRTRGPGLCRSIESRARFIAVTPSPDATVEAEMKRLASAGPASLLMSVFY